MKATSRKRRQDLFLWRSTLLLILAAVVGLAVFRQIRMAGGVVLGLLLYASNLLLMIEIGRSLLRGGKSSRPKLVASLSSTGRLLFLAIALSLIAVFLGSDVLLGACGGFLIAQVNLHVSTLGNKRE